MLDLLFPRRCAACGARGWPVCGRCAERVPVITPPLCRRCGRPAEEPLARCADCPPPCIHAARAPFLYAGPLARAVRAMKYAGWRVLAPALAGAMVAAWDGAAQAEAVTWVPLSRRRRARRGFDQAEVLARAVAAELALPARRMLRRPGDAPAQAGRSGRERRSTPAGPFLPVGTPAPSVLLVDDVLTTGATAAACARALRGAGAARVSVLTAARTLHRGVPARCFAILTGGPSPGSVVARRISLR